MFEVEAKFAVDDFFALERKYQFGDPILERDVYYQHPSRDFLNGDEWLRVRTKNNDVYRVVTYKGANEVTESGVKTRQEIEFRATVNVSELLQILGFKELVRVEKYRRQAKLCVECTQLTITLDDVPALGKYVEIEVLSETNNELAVQTIQTLAKELGLNRPEKSGYAKLMLKKK